MTKRALLYALAQFLVSFGTAATICVTPKDWIVAACGTLGSALLTAIAKMDNAGPGR